MAAREPPRTLIDAELPQRRRRRRDAQGPVRHERVQAARRSTRTTGSRSAIPAATARCRLKDNAIYRLSAGLSRLAAFEFPVHLNEVTRAYFSRSAPRRRRGADAAGHARGGARLPDRPPPRGSRAVAVFQRAAAHDVRGDEARGWTCAERAAAARGGERQLPDLPGRIAGGGDGGAQGGGRPAIKSRRWTKRRRASPRRSATT